MGTLMFSILNLVAVSRIMSKNDKVLLTNNGHFVNGRHWNGTTNIDNKLDCQIQ